MILLFRQTSSNCTQTFDLECDRRYIGSGALGSFSRFQPIWLYDKDGRVRLRGGFAPSGWKNYLPFRGFFGWEQVRQCCTVTASGRMAGTIVSKRCGMWKQLYELALENGSVLQAFPIAQDTFCYVSFYLDGQQIALLETYLHVQDYKFTYKLYLPDAFSEWSDILSVFVLYFANAGFVKRFHMSAGTTGWKIWRYTAYTDKYDPAWRKTHFPQENFFGPIHSDGATPPEPTDSKSRL